MRMLVQKIYKPGKLDSDGFSDGGISVVKVLMLLHLIVDKLEQNQLLKTQGKLILLAGIMP